MHVVEKTSQVRRAARHLSSFMVTAGFSASGAKYWAADPKSGLPTLDLVPRPGGSDRLNVLAKVTDIPPLPKLYRII